MIHFLVLEVPEPRRLPPLHRKVDVRLLDLYHTPPDSSEHQYKSRTCRSNPCSISWSWKSQNPEGRPPLPATKLLRLRGLGVRFVIYRCRANSAHVRQSRPDYGPGFQKGSPRAPKVPPPAQEGRYTATCKKELKLPWREAGPSNHLDDRVGSDQ